MEMDGPGGPLVAGGHLFRDRSGPNLSFIAKILPFIMDFSPVACYVDTPVLSLIPRFPCVGRGLGMRLSHAIQSYALVVL